MTTPVQDVQTVTSKGESIQPVPEGVSFFDITTHVDERGTVCEVFDPRWGWHKDPLVFVYSFTIRPGMIKGWGLHEHHEDRYCLLLGEMEVVLYDERPNSSTRGMVSRIVLSDYRRRLLNIPAGVWHADRNIGDRDVVVVNCPTIQYDHEKPDKFRLPLDNDRIPFKFDNPRGW